MRFYNGVPITVVSELNRMPTGTESTSRRRAEEEASHETDARASKCRTRPRGSVVRGSTP